MIRFETIRLTMRRSLSSEIAKTRKLLRTAIATPLALGLVVSGWPSSLSAQQLPPARQQDSEAAVEATATVKADDDDQGRLDAIETKLDRLTDQVQAITKQLEAMLKKPANQEGTESEATEPETTEPEKTPTRLTEEWLVELPWRSLGPANMAGRITDVEIHVQDPSLWWIATASGGLLKTQNRGTTIEHQFDHESTISIGAIASDPQNTETLWVGTGEINPRNSVSYGNGVYKSTDGGKTWNHMGLKETYQIARILVHPKDSDVVYVGAAGRLYGTNSERGVYKTTDGGKTWEQVLFLDDRTGVIDMIMDPENPEVLIAAMWDRLRDGFDSWPGEVPKPDGIDSYDPIRKWGPKAGLYKTTDGGANWNKLSVGLPEGMTGRIGLDWQTGGVHAIYAIIDCEDIGKGPRPFAAYLGLVGQDADRPGIITQVLPGSPAAKEGVEVGDVLLEVEGEKIATFDDILDQLREKKVGERIQFVVARGDRRIELAPKLSVRPGQRGGAPTVFMGVTGETREGKIVLTRITEEGPAAKAGLKVDDQIVSVDGKDPGSYDAWIKSIQAKAIGDKVSLKVQRGESSIDVEVTLGSRPAQGQQQQQSRAIMGIRGEDAEDGGALLTSITAGGPSAKAGLKDNDVVVKVDDTKVENYEGLIAEIRKRQPDDEMKVEVKREDKTVRVTVTLGDRAGGNNPDRPYFFSYFGQQPNVQDMQGAKGANYGGIYKSTDAGETWQRVNSMNVRPMYFSVIRVDPNDDQRVYVLGVSQYQSSNGGATFTSDFGRGVHSDSHDLWIDPQDGRHMVIGSDGGFYVTYDRGKNWDHVNTAAIGQFYHATIAPTKPYRVYGGLQDNGSWGGPAISRTGGALNEDWISVGGGDGFVCRVDPNDPDVVYSESQNGGIRRRNLRTGAGASIRPPRVEGLSYRFNWNTPFILSSHNSKIFYSAANYVFRSVNRGDNQKVISPEITLTKRGSATALAESPIDPDVLYVGSDDGALWVTQDGGENWTNITENLGVDPRWVATIEASRYEAGRVYVCLDGHRSDDDDPYGFVSDDFGKTFRRITSELPRGSSRCLREDVINENLLYLGTEFGFWISVDRGESWVQCNQKLPTVAVHEVAMHPDVNEVVLATHGRSLWATDVSGLRSLSKENLDEKVALFDPVDVIRWRRDPSRGRTNRRYVGQNPRSGAQIWYSLPEEQSQVRLRIENIEGRTIAQLNGNGKPGLHLANWDLIQNPARGTRGRRQAAPAGDYRVVLSVAGEDVGSQIFSVENDPSLASDAVSEAEFLQMLADQAEEEEEDEGESSDRSID